VGLVVTKSGNGKQKKKILREERWHKGGAKGRQKRTGPSKNSSATGKVNLVGYGKKGGTILPLGSRKPRDLKGRYSGLNTNALEQNSLDFEKSETRAVRERIGALWEKGKGKSKSAQ